MSIVDKMPSALSGDTIDYGLARYGYIPASWVVAETLEALGGYGLKTAVEAIFMATDSGAVPPFEDVISIAGTDKGADTAIVAKSTFSSSVFSGNPAERFQVLEIIAMPRTKKWYKRIGVGGLYFQEVEKGETLGPGAQNCNIQESDSTKLSERFNSFLVWKGFFCRYSAASQHCNYDYD